MTFYGQGSVTTAWATHSPWSILNIEVEIWVDFYLKEIRSIPEFGVACWNNVLTIKQSDQIERIQKICVNVLICHTEWEISYKIGCTLLGVEPLYLRRKELCIIFIQKCSLNPMNSDLFTFCQNINTRQEKQLYSVQRVLATVLQSWKKLHALHAMRVDILPRITHF